MKKSGVKKLRDDLHHSFMWKICNTLNDASHCIMCTSKGHFSHVPLFIIYLLGVQYRSHYFTLAWFLHTSPTFAYILSVLLIFTSPAHTELCPQRGQLTTWCQTRYISISRFIRSRILQNDIAFARVRHNKKITRPDKFNCWLKKIMSCFHRNTEFLHYPAVSKQI